MIGLAVPPVPNAPHRVRWMAYPVRAELHDDETTVVDARRDRSLVGSTLRSWGDDGNRLQAVVVLHGRATTVTYDERYGRDFVPVALRGANGFVVPERERRTKSSRPVATGGFRAARLRGGRIVLGAKTGRPIPAPPLAPSGTSTVPGGFAWNRSPVQVTWWRLGDLTVGSGIGYRDGTDPASGYKFQARIGKSFARLADGRVVPLASLAEGHRPLLELLYVSREGWAVARTETGFAWIVPKRR